MTSESIGPTSFQGLPWEAWTNFLGRSVPIDDKPPEPKTPEENKAGAMKLSKEDMKIFGLCPEQDPFTVVVCEICKMCVKQQALAEHYEKRHLNQDARPVVLPIPERPIVPERMTAKVVRNPSAKGKRKRMPSKETGSGSKGKKTMVNSMPSLPVSLPLERVAPLVVDNPPIKVEVLQPVVTVTATATATMTAATNATNKQTTKPRKNAPIKQREYDPDKHCGVVSQETMKPCTWCLNCKSHAMSLRRAVTGRSKPIDQLLADHREAKEARIKQKKNLKLLNSSVMLTPPQLPVVIINSSFKPERQRVSRGRGRSRGRARESGQLGRELEPEPGVQCEQAASVSSAGAEARRDAGQASLLSLSLNPPRPLSVPTPMFLGRKIGGLIYTNRRMQVARQAMETCMNRVSNTLTKSGTTIYHPPASFFSSVLDHDHHKK